jgi:hypothetical protein
MDLNVRRSGDLLVTFLAAIHMSVESLSVGTGGVVRDIGKQQPSSGLDRSRRRGMGQPRDWAGMTPNTTNNSETSRQIAIKATHKVVQNNRKQCCLISSLTLDVTHTRSPVRRIVRLISDNPALTRSTISTPMSSVFGRAIWLARRR